METTKVEGEAGKTKVVKAHRFTYTRNDSIMKSLKLEITCSNSPLKQGHLEPVVQKHIQAAFSCLHYLSGHLCQCSVTFTVKKCLLTFTQNLPHFSLCPMVLALPLGTTKSLALYILFLYTLISSSPETSSG